MFHLLLGIVYLSFISLGLPDSLLGSAWPLMYQEFSVPVSYAGGISMIISAGTIFSSLQSDRLTRRFGTGVVTAVSVSATAIALFGFSVNDSYLELCLWAVPYGLGAGSVDAALNNYVALHYAGSHMSWLHCMWGVGASLGPYIMGYALSGGQGWNMGYRCIALLQFILSAILLLTLPLWKKRQGSEENTPCLLKEGESRPLSIAEIVRIPGAGEILAAFFCYSALEQTTGLWAGSYLVLCRGFSAEEAAVFVSLFFLGITAGRAVSGFLTVKLGDTGMIHLGEAVILSGMLCFFLPFGNQTAAAGLILTGLGCAPVYPSIIHSTPEHFGADKSQAVIGVQMAFAYVGSLSMPPLFGVIANHISAALFPAYLMIILILMAVMYEKMLLKVREKRRGTREIQDKKISEI